MLLSLTCISGSRTYASFETGTENTVTDFSYEEGNDTDMPRALHDMGYNWLGSDRYVEDGSFLRFKYLTFNYSIIAVKLIETLKLAGVGGGGVYPPSPFPILNFSFFLEAISF